MREEYRVLLTNKKGVKQPSKQGKDLHIGDCVMYPGTVDCRGGRGDVRFGFVIGFDRFPQILRGNRHDLNAISDMLDNGRNPLSWQDRSEAGVKGYVEGVSSHYLTKCSQRFVEQWNDGTLFDD